MNKRKRGFDGHTGAQLADYLQEHYGHEITVRQSGNLIRIYRNGQQLSPYIIPSGRIEDSTKRLRDSISKLRLNYSQ